MKEKTVSCINQFYKEVLQFLATVKFVLRISVMYYVLMKMSQTELPYLKLLFFARCVTIFHRTLSQLVVSDDQGDWQK